LASVVHLRRQPRRGRRGGLARAARLLPEPLRSLTAKDVRTFCRDFSQWSQAALFFGVLAVYVANLRAASLGFSIAFWQQWVTMLNTVACLLVLATLTTRFVFPLISLEGRRFWILRLAPLRLATLVRQKFWLSVAFSLTVTVALIAVSGWRLHLPGLVFTITVTTVAAASFALSGLAVGLGSLFPDFAADTPARVVSGTGGTLTFIVSLAYIVLIAAAEAALLRWASLAPTAGRHAVPTWLALLAIATIAVSSAAATVLPLRLGIASLERAEL
jgi:ABC-2 type transport system permease protein